MIFYALLNYLQVLVPTTLSILSLCTKSDGIMGGESFMTSHLNYHVQREDFLISPRLRFQNIVFVIFFRDIRILRHQKGFGGGSKNGNYC